MLQHHAFNRISKLYVLCKAGATLSTVFLQEHLIDKMISYVGPSLLGQLGCADVYAEFDRMEE